MKATSLQSASFLSLIIMSSNLELNSYLRSIETTSGVNDPVTELDVELFIFTWLLRVDK
jgi:hypothetical protein